MIVTCSFPDAWSGSSKVLADDLGVYQTPRSVAGEDLTLDNNECRLEPPRRNAYRREFTDAQWNRLKQVFAHGVCDYSRPGVSQQKTIEWLTYLDEQGRAVYGGVPLGPAPRSQPLHVNHWRTPHSSRE